MLLLLIIGIEAGDSSSVLQRGEGESEYENAGDVGIAVNEELEVTEEREGGRGGL